MLGVERVGVDDNFFDLGGHSLLLVRVQAGCAQSFGRELSIVDLFRYPTVEALAEHLAGDASATARPRRHERARSGARQRAEARPQLTQCA